MPKLVARGCTRVPNSKFDQARDPSSCNPTHRIRGGCARIRCSGGQCVPGPTLGVSDTTSVCTQESVCTQGHTRAHRGTQGHTGVVQNLDRRLLIFVRSILGPGKEDHGHAAMQPQSRHVVSG
jgi:hypothetical protein